ncbi:hypothetical protein ABW20_dc0107533 [Dactylellina cionopaga]|nr:hypothetical protein ABW20_dc0107533 [Dactylellina cionopaga]
MTSLVNRTLYGPRHNITKEDAAKIAEPATTFPSPNFKNNIKYLAYGSNLSAETFLGKRGIKPLSKVSVRVPSLTLSFDLAGVPYKEPRFANVRPRDEGDQELIGVVYEVTPTDYATILKTEGGYSVIDVPCFPLTPVAGVDSFQSKTLIIPTDGTRTQHDGLPSLRYLNLLLHGAKENALPQEYQDYLANTGYYEASTLRQKLGAGSAVLTALPVVILLFALRIMLSDKEGKGPHWLITAQRIWFRQVWSLYDHIWRPLYGDGESDKHLVMRQETIVAAAEPASETDALLGRVEEISAANGPENGSRV